MSTPAGPLRLYRARKLLIDCYGDRMVVESGNLLRNLPDASQKERFEHLLARDDVRIERITSRGQATPEGEWCDQEQNEFVLLVSGQAGLLIEGEPQERVMSDGDWIMLPARCRHRVVWTSAGADTVWLAMHWPFA